MEEKKEVIKISLELQRKIAKEIGISVRSVQSALRFESNSPSARIIRAYALNHGGQHTKITIIEEIVENPYIEVVTLK